MGKAKQTEAAKVLRNAELLFKRREFKKAADELLKVTYKTPEAEGVTAHHYHLLWQCYRNEVADQKDLLAEHDRKPDSDPDIRQGIVNDLSDARKQAKLAKAAYDRLAGRNVPMDNRHPD